MLQRIQTVYLLIIVALMTATLFLPLASIQIENAFCQFDATGIASAKELIYPTWGYYIWNAQKISGESFSFNCKIALTFPVISLILDYLAIRNIGADEALVRSLERLR